MMEQASDTDTDLTVADVVALQADCPTEHA